AFATIGQCGVYRIPRVAPLQPARHDRRDCCERQRDREKGAVRSREPDEQAPGCSSPMLGSPEVIKGADHAAQKQRLGVDRAEEQREGKRGQKPSRRTSELVASEHLACKSKEVDERNPKGHERDQGAREYKCGRRPAEQPRSSSREQRERGKEDDVLLILGSIGIVLIAFQGDAEVPACIPSDLQVAKLV